MSSTVKEIAEYRAEAAAWLRANIPPRPDFHLPLTFMEVGTDAQLDYMREWQRRLHAAGFLGASWPREYGGQGLTHAHQLAVDAELRAQRAPIIFNVIGTGWAGPMLMHLGSDEDKARYLERILTAEDIWCQGFSEPDNGSDLGNVQTRAVRDGDEYVVNGSKIWTTLGNYADYMILLARTNPDAASKYAGLSFFLAPMKIPGVSTTPIRKLTGDYGFTQTFFDDARIPVSCRVGEEGEGWSVAMKILEFERSVTGGQATTHMIAGVSMADLLQSLAAVTRGGQPVLEDAVVRDELVGLLIQEKSLALNERRANIPALSSDYPGSLQLGSKRASTEFAREMRRVSAGLQGLQGGLYMGDPDAVDDGFWQYAYMNAFNATIGGGTSQIQANILAEHVLGLPKS